MEKIAYSELIEVVQSMAKDVDTYYNELHKVNPHSITIRGTVFVSLFEDFANTFAAKLSAEKQEKLWSVISILINMGKISGYVESSH